VTAPPPTLPVPAVAKGPLPPPSSLPKPAKLGKMPDAAPQVAAVPAQAKAGGGAPPPPEKAPAPQPAPAADQPPLVISLKEILGSWPEPIKSEAAALNGAMVSLPAADVSSGLAKGKVAFAWGQIRSWMNPPPTKPSEGADSTELVLPLRVIAPAFLKHTKGAGPAKKGGEVGDIPELFAGTKTKKPKSVPKPQPEPAPEAKAPAPEPKAKAPEPPPAAEPEPAPAPAPATPAPVAEPEPVIEAKAPVEEKPAEAEVPAPEVPAPVSAPEAPATEAPEAAAKVEAPSPEPAPSVAEPPPKPAAEAETKPEPAPAPAPVVAAVPQTLGELFGQTDKTAWSPTEVVNRLTELPDFVGAVVALQEGLVIAHKLPEPLKGEIFAAFLPQIFARLNQYSGEMSLGTIDEVVVHTEAGPCHLFRRGQVLFAALAKPGSAVPAQILRLCADAVAS
jgi:predicted regulator of Ras-like GTPase activity (Roadblock/LC7/MglB family)